VLIPGKVAMPERRPPYFTIDLEPLAGWVLNLKATGDRFLRVRTPFFRGEVSANLNLEGTLREPVALGHTTIESGIVTFPFGTLRIEQGLVTLSSENPYEPQLSVTASSRTFGYELKMEVTGPAAKPVIQFSSTPALSSEQIVLMLTAGELPRNELIFSTQQKAARLGFFLGKNLLSKLSPEMGEERFTLRSGETISRTGRETYSLEYKLSDDWSLVGEYDRFNDFNAGVKWRIYSR
jgi:translocation and assembly module TamB